MFTLARVFLLVVSSACRAKCADHLPQRPKTVQYLPDCPTYYVLLAMILRTAITGAYLLSNIKDSLCVMVAVFVIIHTPLFCVSHS